MRVVNMPNLDDLMKALSSLILSSRPGSSLFLALYLFAVRIQDIFHGRSREGKKAKGRGDERISGLLCRSHGGGVFAASRDCVWNESGNEKADCVLR